MASVFLSYAHGDDGRFVRRLYRDLRKAGFDVWFDMVSMPSRQLTFYQEIRDAIAAADRLVLVVGPHAVTSDYVNQEWRFACFEAQKCVSAVVRRDGQQPDGAPIDGYDLIPEDLRAIHAEDFRDDKSYRLHLANLIRQLSEPAPRPGRLVGVPELPAHYTAQTARLREVRSLLLADLAGPVVVTGAAARVGLQGMGGIGKTVLACALARTPEIRRAFPDGIYWVTLGTEPRLEELQSSLLQSMGATGGFAGIEGGKQRLRDVLESRAALLVLDDAWHAAHVEAFNVIAGRCRLLLTTRDSALSAAFASASNCFQVELPSRDEAHAILTMAVGTTLSTPDLDAIIGQTGRLPLALALCGGMIRSGVSVAFIVEALSAQDLAYISGREALFEQHQNLWRAFEVSLNVLPAQTRDRFIELSVFPPDRGAPLAAVAMLWGRTAALSPRMTAKLLAELGTRSLLEFVPDERAGSSGHVRLHDLIHKFASAAAEAKFGGSEPLHRTLIDAYGDECSAVWEQGPDDGYYFENLGQHFVAAGELDRAVALVTQLSWIEVKCRLAKVLSLQADYRVILGATPETQHERERESARATQLAGWIDQVTSYARQWTQRRRGAAKRNAPGPEPPLPEPPQLVRMWTQEEIEAECTRIRQNPTRVDRLNAFAQFIDREFHGLLAFGNRDGFVVQQALYRFGAGPVREAAQHAMRIVAAPVLIRRWPDGVVWNPRPALIRTLRGHLSKGLGGGVTGMSVTPDFRTALALTSGSELRRWDIRSGACLYERSTSLGRVCITPDGHWAITGAHDGSVRIWDVNTGSCVKTIDAHREQIVSVSITPDGAMGMSGCRDGTARVWDLESGACLLEWKGPGCWSNAVVGLLPSGCCVTIAQMHELNIIDLRTGAVTSVIEGDYDDFDNVAVTPDLRLGISSSDHGKMRIWDLEGGTRRHEKEGRGGALPGVDVTPDGKRAITGSSSNHWPGDFAITPMAVHVWDTNSGDLLRTLRGHSDSVTEVAVSPDGRFALSGGFDETLRLWDIECGLDEASNQVPQSVVTLGASASRQRAISETWSSDRLQLWDLPRATIYKELSGHEPRLLAIAGNVTTALSGTARGVLRVWDLESGRVRRSIKCPGLSAVAVSADGTLGVTVDRNRNAKLKLWDLKTGKCRLKLKVGDSGKLLEITDDARIAVTLGHGSNEPQVWDLVRGSHIHALSGQPGHIQTLVMMSDGRRAIAFASQEAKGSGWMWDLHDGVCLQRLEGVSWHPRIALSADGSRAIGARWSQLQIWDLKTGVLEHAVYVGARILSLCLAPDGRTGFFSTDDRTVQMWDIERQTCIGLLVTDDPVHEMSLAGTALILGTKGGQVQFLEVVNATVKSGLHSS